MKILAFGEVMMRLNPNGFKKMTQTDSMDFSFTGTGLNILAGLAQNGYDTTMLTALPDNNLGKTAAANIRKLNVSDRKISYSGNHLGIYILELGYGGRPSEVTYLDRAHSAFNEWEVSESDLEQALENVDLIHICGIALSTSAISRKNALTLAKKASEKGIEICFDFNFRASLNNEEGMTSLLAAYHEILPLVTISFGSLRDLKELLKIPGETEEDVVQTFMSNYGIRIFSGTYRHQEGNQKQLQGFVYQGNKKVVSDKITYEVWDRIGTGDAFVAGILTGLIEKWAFEKTVKYGVYNALLAHTTVGDSPVLSKEFVLNYMEKQVDVIR